VTPVPADPGKLRRAVALQADACKPAGARQRFTDTAAAMGQVDIVVTSTGIEPADALFLNRTEQQCGEVVGVNVNAARFTVQEAARTKRYLPVDGGAAIR
jgi:NAD(P)-dependent dehydrogenase (short-subunit alcohol dehydrogenase family)